MTKEAALAKQTKVFDLNGYNPTPFKKGDKFYIRHNGRILAARLKKLIVHAASGSEVLFETPIGDVENPFGYDNGVYRNLQDAKTCENKVSFSCIGGDEMAYMAEKAGFHVVKTDTIYKKSENIYLYYKYGNKISKMRISVSELSSVFYDPNLYSQIPMFSYDVFNGLLYFVVPHQLKYEKWFLSETQCVDESEFDVVEFGDVEAEGAKEKTYRVVVEVSESQLGTLKSIVGNMDIREI